MRADGGGACEAWTDALTYDEWWAEWGSNACCPDSVTAARRLCGCRGSGADPTPYISPLLARVRRSA